MPDHGEHPVHDGLGEAIGIEAYEAGREWARARVSVTDRVRQEHGVVHGGAYSALAESICSRATSATVRPARALGQSNSASFLRPISAGHLNAEARARHRGRTTWLWDVEVTDDEGRLCALVRVTIAVRDAGSVTAGPDRGRDR